MQAAQAAKDLIGYRMSLASAFGKRSKDQDSRVRLAAASALGKSKASNAVQLLGMFIRDDNDIQVRKEAARSLSKIDKTNSAKAFITILKDNRSILRLRAAEALGEIGDSKAIEPLKEVSQNDTSAEVREVASEALNKISKGL